MTSSRMVSNEWVYVFGQTARDCSPRGFALCFVNSKRRLRCLATFHICIPRPRLDRPALAAILAVATSRTIGRRPLALLDVGEPGLNYIGIGLGDFVAKSASNPCVVCQR